MATDSASARLAKALSHPTRIRILMAMNAPARRMSPSEFSREKGIILSHAAYHFRRLEKSQFIELVSTRQVRGSTEHYYQPVGKAMA